MESGMGKFNIEDIDIRQNVSDFAGIIEPGYEKKIHDVIVDIEARTSAEAAVVTLDSLEGISIDEAANNLFNKFGVGKKKVNNGILLLISNRDGKFRFELGYGLEHIIDEKMRQDLIEKVMGPEFRREHFGPAILGFLKRVSRKIARSRVSNISLASWLAGMLSLVFSAAGIFSSLMLAITVYPDIGRPSALVMLFVKTCIPAMALALAAVTLAIADLSIDPEIPGEQRMISKSIAGLIMGVLAVIWLFTAFFLFTFLAEFMAGIFYLPTSGY
jgi:uncharacterized membrane protein YgcG